MEYFARFISLDDIITEVTTTLRKYEYTGHITEERIIEAVMSRIKFFGTGLMTEQEDIIPVSNYVGMLPSNLHSVIDIAKCKCTPLCTCGVKKSPCDQDEPQEEKVCGFSPDPSPVFKTVVTNKYDEAYKECTICNAQISTEFQTQYEILPNIKYVSVCDKEDVALGNSFLRANGMCKVASCAKYKVDLSGRMLKTTFSDGTLYIKYLGIPLDEDGRPLILDSEQGFLYEHLRYFVLARMLEYVQIEDNTASRLYSDMLTLANRSTRPAIADVKASKFSNTSYIKIWNKRQAESNKYFTKLR